VPVRFFGDLEEWYEDPPLRARKMWRSGRTLGVLLKSSAAAFAIPGVPEAMGWPQEERGPFSPGETFVGRASGDADFGAAGRQ